MKNAIFLLLTTFLLIACNKQSTESDIDLSGSILLKPLDDQNLLSDEEIRMNYSIISCKPITNSSNLIFSGDNKVIRFGNKILVADKKVNFVLLLDSNAKFLKNISSFGNKEGEFLSVNDIYYDTFNKEILLYTAEKRALLKFDENGVLKEDIKLKFYGSKLTVLDKDHYAFFINQNKSKTSEFYDVLVTDKNTNVIKRGLDWRPLQNISYDYSGGFSASSSSLLNKSLSDSLFEVSSEKFKLKYIISFGDKTLPNKKIPTLKGLSTTLFKYSVLMVPMIDTKNYLKISYNDSNKLTSSIFNKQTGRSIRSNQVSEIFPVSMLFQPSSGEYSSDQFYSLVKPSTIINHLNKNPSDWDVLKKTSKTLFNMIKTAKPTDNPIIITFKFTFK